MIDKEHYECGLSEYLQRDLDEYKKALVNGSNLMDCLWCELYGSINAAEITDGVITPEHADYLRKKYLFGDTQQKVMAAEPEIFHSMTWRSGICSRHITRGMWKWSSPSSRS